MMDEPKISIKEISQKEKHILLNALSLKQSSTISTSKPKFLSHSLPNSAKSSPLFTSKRKSKNGVIESPRQANNMPLKHQLLLQETHLRKSKSCGEARASAAFFDEFDIWLAKPNVMEHDNIMHHDNMHHHDSYSFSKTIKESPLSCKELETNADDEGFKCSALCIYLPGFGKTKQVKAKKVGSGIEGLISRNVSLEKFECASWGSSTLLHEIGRDSKNSYFDLPLELIKCSNNNDVHEPVTSAFVFEKELKGVLKNGSSRTNARKSDASSHHVRFSISESISYPPSPASCNSLRKAREDLNVFIEAQNA